MSHKISRIIIGTEEVISLIILLLVIATIIIIIVAMPCTIFTVLTGFISLLTAIFLCIKNRPKWTIIT